MVLHGRFEARGHAQRQEIRCFCLHPAVFYLVFFCFTFVCFLYVLFVGLLVYVEFVYLACFGGMLKHNNMHFGQLLLPNKSIPKTQAKPSRWRHWHLKSHRFSQDFYRWPRCRRETAPFRFDRWEDAQTEDDRTGDPETWKKDRSIRSYRSSSLFQSQKQPFPKASP